MTNDQNLRLHYRLVGDGDTAAFALAQSPQDQEVADALDKAGSLDYAVGCIWTGLKEA